MSTILAIDPGPLESGWVVIDVDTRRPIAFGKHANEALRADLLIGQHPAGSVVIEMVASYGMSVGAEVFDTCVWIGRFVEIVGSPALAYRRDVKLHHCHSMRANDSNIRQALVDRFAAGQPNRGKGTKARPGWFYGFRADIWQAYALAVYAADNARPTEGGEG